MGFLDIDGKFMQILGKLTDIMWLGILVLVTSIPVFTIGASITACYTLTIKMADNREGHITKAYFKAFKENFRKATALWGIEFLLLVIILMDYWALTQVEVGYQSLVKGGLWFLSFLFLITANYVFYLQAKYSNTVKNTFKNAFFLSFIHILTSLVVFLITLVPVVLMYLIPRWDPFIIWFAVPVVCYFNSVMLNRAMEKYEKEEGEESKSNEDSSDPS